VYVNQFGGTCDGSFFYQRLLAGLSVIDRTGSLAAMRKCSALCLFITFEKLKIQIENYTLLWYFFKP
jgi:hypothetical protein